MIRHSQLLNQIDNTDSSILSSTCIPRLAKYFTPTLSTSKSYNLYYNNEFFNPHSGHDAISGGILSSTGFKISGNSNVQYFDDDGEGNIRSYYLVGNTRTYTNETAGTINYSNGDIAITTINITEVSNVDDVASSRIRMIAIPNSYDVVALRNQVLSIDLVNTAVTGSIDTISSADASGAVSFNPTAASVTSSGTSY